VQHRAAVAEPRHAFAIEQVRVDARHLRRDVGAHAHRLARVLVDHLEGAHVEIVAGAGEKRVGEFQQRRNHQFIFFSKK